MKLKSSQIDFNEPIAFGESYSVKIGDPFYYYYHSMEPAVLSLIRLGRE
jgi:hypothetical protein